ncbi:DUF2189 domain-containing protein [Fodinicurvata sediminis]|uniref:DUF2189 domain-containing protein n=1 Tax=Fodinicurvata sediminis TaxID=1121832 RepID=UPI0003B61A15|nr:DUF2189 domain-containing protein [Fodinicurvata sediminis]
MAKLPDPVPPLPRDYGFQRDLPAMAAFDWLKAGWADFRKESSQSLAYGILAFVLSFVLVGGLFALSLDYILFPAIAGFMVVGPFLAIGLYEKSRRIQEGRPVTLGEMILVRGESGGQMLFTGVLLCLLMLLWMRAAVLIYALFFGLTPFPGLDDVAGMLFTTATGWWLLIVGSLVGGLFAAFAFAISVFAVPMLLNERTDALTAMGTSMALVWNNLPIMLVWGAIVVVLFGVSVLTAFLGLIVAFPVLGHATWHAYLAIRQPGRRTSEAPQGNLEEGYDGAVS